MTDGPDETIVDEEKPHRGRIAEWRFVPWGAEGRTLLTGRFLDHYAFAGLEGRTSWVVSHDEATGEVETRNSRYTLVGPPKEEEADGLA